MERTSPPLRKKLLDDEANLSGVASSEIDLARDATIGYSSEDPAYPVEHLADGRGGSSGTRWVSGRPNMTEQIVIEFDRPQAISRLIYEAEECECERTQEVRVGASCDRGATYKQVLVQEYTFSRKVPLSKGGFSRLARRITHLRLEIVPNKRGAGAATLTALRLFR